MKHEYNINGFHNARQLMSVIYIFKMFEDTFIYTNDMSAVSTRDLDFANSLTVKWNSVYPDTLVPGKIIQINEPDMMDLDIFCSPKKLSRGEVSGLVASGLKRLHRRCISIH
jgi:hypothetical protein